MRAGGHHREITIERKAKPSDPEYVAPDSSFGTEKTVWVPLSKVGSPPAAERFGAEVMDVMPSRSEAVTQGLVVARNQTRIRMRWRDDVTSDMRVTVHGDSDVIYQIVGGPAEIEGRKERIEMVLEKYSS